MIDFSDPRPASATTSSPSPKIAWKCVGTMKTFVIGSACSACSTRSGSNFVSTVAVPPRNRFARVKDNPAPWYIGATVRPWSRGPNAPYSAAIAR